LFREIGTCRSDDPPRYGEAKIIGRSDEDRRIKLNDRFLPQAALLIEAAIAMTKTAIDNRIAWKR